MARLTLVAAALLLVTVSAKTNDLKKMKDENQKLRAELARFQSQRTEIAGQPDLGGAAGAALTAGANGNLMAGALAGAKHLLGGAGGAVPSQTKMAAPQAAAPPAGGNGVGVFIPFGKHIERSPSVSYYLATGYQECQVCHMIIEEAYKYGPSFYDLCGLLAPEMQEMCRAQQRVLQSCPEFTNDWCYQDLGGTQALRSPCPRHLKCHYCLGMNPLHCIDLDDEDGEEDA